MIERVMSVSTVIFAAFFIVVSFQIEDNANNAIGPATWPMVLMGIMLILGLTLTFQVFKAYKQQKKQEDQFDEAEGAEEDDEDKIIFPKKLYYLFGILVAYVIGLHYLGFIVSTLIVTFVLALLFGMKKWMKSLITSVICTGSFVFLFPILLNLSFPRGVGFFREISILFY